MSRREKKREATRQQITEAAARLFAERGFDATSIDEIAELADVAKGTFYYHFESKEDVVIELRRQPALEDIERAHALLDHGADPLTVLERVVKSGIRWAEQNLELAQVLFHHRFGKFMLPKPPTCDEKMPPYPQLVLRIMTLGQENGTVRKDVEAIELAQMIGSMLLSGHAAWFIAESPGPLSHKVLTWLRVLVSGITCGAEVRSGASFMPDEKTVQPEVR